MSKVRNNSANEAIVLITFPAVLFMMIIIDPHIMTVAVLSLTAFSFSAAVYFTLRWIFRDGYSYSVLASLWRRKNLDDGDGYTGGSY